MNRQGFSVIEAILVIAMVVTAIAIIVVVLNPNRQLNDIRNVQTSASPTAQ